MTRRDLVRGQLLVEQGGASDALFLVLHGALAVYRTDHPDPIAELRAGELVGEIGFFANIPRTANVIAIRDTSVMVLTRAAYTKLAQDAPAIVEAVLAALARRFATETARLLPARASPRPHRGAGHRRTPAGPPDFEQRLRSASLPPVPRSSTSRGSGDVSRARARYFRGRRLAQPDRDDAPLVVYVGGEGASDWARRPFARPTSWCSPAARYARTGHRDRELRLRRASGVGAAPGVHV